MTEQSQNLELERLFLRLASLTTAEQLSVFVEKYLLQCIAFVSSDYEHIRQKGMEILTHLNKRIKSNTNVQIPVEYLVNVYIESPDPVVLNFVLIYIKLGLPRLPETHRIQLLPYLCTAMSCDAAKSHLNDLLSLYAPVAASLSLIEKHLWPLNVLPDNEIRKEILDFILDILLLPSAAGNLKFQMGGVKAPAGMSEAGFERAKGAVVNCNLEELKCRLIKFVDLSGVPSTDCLVLCGIACSDPSHTVVSCAEMELKKMDIPACLESKATVSRLFHLYLGSNTGPSPRRGCSIRQRLKLFPLLLKSPLASLHFPHNIQLIFDGFFGEQTVPKLSQLAAQFSATVAEHCPEAGLTTFGPVLWSGLRKVIDQTQDPRLACLAYQALDRVGVKCEKLVVKDLAFVKTMFDAVANESDEVGSAVADCLTSWLPIFSKAEAHARKIIQTLVEQYINHTSTKCQMLSLKYVDLLFAKSDVPSKWLLCVASENSNSQLKKEADYIIESCLSQPKKMPKFEDLLQHFADKIQSDRTMPSPAVWSKALLLCRSCLLANHNSTVPLPTTEMSLESFRQHSPTVSKALNQTPGNLSQIYCQLIAALCLKQPDLQSFCLALEAVQALGEPSATLFRSSPGLPWLQDQLNVSSSPAFCSIGAQLYAALLPKEKVAEVLESLLNQLESAKLEPSLSLLHLTTSICPLNPHPSLSLVTEHLLSKLPLDRPNVLGVAVCEVLATIYTHGGADWSLEIRNKVVKDAGNVVGSMKDTLKPTHKQAALRLLGAVPTGETDRLCEEIVEALCKVANGPPQPDLELFVGEALLNAVLGRLSPSHRNAWIETEQDYLETREVIEQPAFDRLNNLLDKIITEKLIDPNRHVRQASIIWLYVIIQRSANWHPLVQSRADQLQSALIDGLAEGNEFTQGVASKGLSLLYDNSSADQREKMVSVLVESLTAGRKPTHSKVVADTKLLPSGSLGKTPGGESLSTYRELCSLATDLNKPDLVYKFMQLANHQALWNSKMGAAFGVGGVLEQAKEQLEPHLPKLIPKLFRYRYDPDPKIQAAVRSIWQALTSTRKAVIDEFADAIFSELLPCLTASEFRVRESSCLALSDLLSAHSTNKMTLRFGELWETLFRVSDDIKESVRLAAHRALRTLQKLTVRYCSSEKENATELLAMILPVLLEKGLNSGMKESKTLTLSTIMSLSKESGACLRPHLQLLVPCLLESISELEPALLNYLAVRSDEDTLEKMDAARAAAAKSSPLMDALNSCLRYVDTETLVSLSPVICNLLKSSVGLSTRTSTCSFIVSICALCQRELFEAKQVPDNFVRALSHGLLDRNATVRKQYASTIGHLARFCSHDTLGNLLKRLAKKYIDQEAEAESAAVYVCRSLAQNNPESLKDFGPEIAPLALLAMHREVSPEDAEKGAEIKKMWQDVWTELCPGTEGGMRLYRVEIIDLCQSILTESGVWMLKANAAKVLGELIDLIGPELEPANCESLLSLLIDCLSGRTWTGKEAILAAVSNLWSKSNKQLISILSQEKIDNCFESLLKECNKRTVPYKTSALKCTGVFVEKCNYSPGLNAMVDLIKPILTKKSSLYDSDDEESSISRRSETLEFECVAVETLAKCSKVAKDEYETGVKTVIELFCEIIPNSYWKMQQNVVRGFASIFEKPSSTARPIAVDSVISVTVQVLLSAVQSSLSSDCLNALNIVLESVKSGKCTIVCGEKMASLLDQLQTHELCMADAGLQEKICDVKAGL